MKHVLVLGANGQLGQDIVTYTSSDTIKINGLTRNQFNADIDKPDEILSPYTNSDYLVNCIAFHKVDQCEDDFEQSFHINAEFVGNLARFCRKNNITLIHISTDYVFSGTKKEPYTENDLPAPINLYGISKLAGEAFTRAYCEKHFILRVSAMFGTKENMEVNYNFVEKMIHAARKNQALKVIDNQFMSPTHSKDVALAIQAIIEKESTDYGVFHAANSGKCSWFQFAKEILEISNLKTSLDPISYDEFHMHARRPQYCSMTNEKLSPIYKMQPWKDALVDYLRLKGYIAE